MELHLLPFDPRPCPGPRHLRLVWRKVYQVPQAEADHGDGARRENRPIWRQQGRCALDGWHHHHRRPAHPRHSPGPTAQHLSHPDDRHDGMARIPRRHGRLHQNLPPQQGGTERQVQDRRTGLHRPHRGTGVMGLARREVEPEHGAWTEKRTGNRRQAQREGGEDAQNYHPLRQEPQPRLLQGDGLLRRA